MNPKKMAKTFLWIVALVAAIFIVFYAMTAKGAASIPRSAMTSVTFTDFPNIKPNVSTIDWEKQQITIDVDNSKSFAVIPLEEAAQVKKVAFFWKSQGTMKKPATKNDNRLAVGLILSGTRPLWYRFMPPQWMELIDQDINLPFNEILFLNVGNNHRIPGEVWNDPEYKSVRHVAIGDTGTPWEGDWRASTVTFSKPYKTVGFVILADGENTKSQFVTTIKDLTFE